MLTITRYRCEYCGREYENAASCKHCEESHKESVFDVRLLLRIDDLSFSFKVDKAYEHSAVPHVRSLVRDNEQHVYCISWGARCNAANVSSTKKSLLVQASMSMSNVSGALMDAAKEVGND